MDGKTSSIVEEVAQSPSGRWYPTRVRKPNATGRSDPHKSNDMIHEFYLDFETEIPEDLFNPQAPAELK